MVRCAILSDVSVARQVETAKVRSERFSTRVSVSIGPFQAVDWKLSRSRKGDEDVPM